MLCVQCGKSINGKYFAKMYNVHVYNYLDENSWWFNFCSVECIKIFEGRLPALDTKNSILRQKIPITFKYDDTSIYKGLVFIENTDGMIKILWAGKNETK